MIPEVARGDRTAWPTGWHFGMRASYESGDLPWNRDAASLSDFHRPLTQNTRIYLARYLRLFFFPFFSFLFFFFAFFPRLSTVPLCLFLPSPHRTPTIPATTRRGFPREASDCLMIQLARDLFLQLVNAASQWTCVSRTSRKSVEAGDGQLEFDQAENSSVRIQRSVRYAASVSSFHPLASLIISFKLIEAGGVRCSFPSVTDDDCGSGCIRGGSRSWVRSFAPVSALIVVASSGSAFY